MSQKSSVPQAASFVSVVLKRDSHNQLPKVILGVKFTDGMEIVKSQAQAVAA